MNNLKHQTLFDPIRQKDVPATPEELVRQATVKFLMDEVKVPQNLIAVEFALSTVESSTDDRVDILVQDFKDNFLLLFSSEWNINWALDKNDGLELSDFNRE